MSVMGDRLIKVAEARFVPDHHPLTDLERGILESVAVGEEHDCEGKVVDTDFFTWLCTDKAAQRFIHHYGVKLFQARFDEMIDLDFATLPFLLMLEQCTLKKALSLIGAEVRGLYFNDSTLEQGLQACGIQVHGDLFLRGATVKDGIDIIGASIGGDLSCSDGYFIAPDQGPRQGCALDADRAKVAGGVFLDDGFEATGEVRLLGAHIGGNLDCSGGSFIAPVKGLSLGDALSADRAKVAGDVFLKDGFQATGEVRLLGAHIGGNLECSGGSFLAPEQDNFQGSVLTADGIKVAGDVFLKDGFQATGEVRLLGAHIDGDLSCTGGSFLAPDQEPTRGSALCSQQANIKGSVFLRSGQEHPCTVQGSVSLIRARIDGGLCMDSTSWGKEGSLDLRHAKTEVIFDDVGHWPAQGNLHLDGFTYDRIHETSPLDFKSRKDWLGRLPKDGKFRPQPYEQLAKVLRAAGHEGDAKKVCMERRKAWARQWRLFPRWRSEDGTAWRPLSKLGSLLLRIGLGYGYRPGRPFYAMLFTIALGWALFAWANHAKIMVPSQTGKVIQSEVVTATYETDPYPTFNPFFYALDAFVPLVDLHQEVYWMPNTAKDGDCNLWVCQLPLSGSQVRYFLWVYILSGWVLTSLFVVGLTGLVRKDE